MGTTSLKTRKSSSETRKRRDTPNVELLLPDFTQISESEKYEEWSVANTMVPHSGSFPGLRTYSPQGLSTVNHQSFLEISLVSGIPSTTTWGSLIQ